MTMNGQLFLCEFIAVAIAGVVEKEIVVVSLTYIGMSIIQYLLNVKRDSCLICSEHFCVYFGVQRLKIR